MIVFVRVVPNSARNSFEEIEKDYFKVKLKASPEKGKANEALRLFLAETLGISKSQIRIVSGHKSRIKKVELTSSPSFRDKLD